MSDAPILLSWDVGGSVCVWDLATTDFSQMLFLSHELRGCVHCIVTTPPPPPPHPDLH